MSEVTQQPAGEQAAPAEEVTINQVEELLRADEAAERAEPEPESESTPEPEAAKDEEDDEDAAIARGDLRVPLKAERERRRQAEQRLEDVNRHQMMLAQHIAQIQQQLVGTQPRQPNQPKVPDFESDPAGHLQHQLAQVRTALGALQKRQAEEAQVEQARAVLSRAEQAVASQEQAFNEKNPDYYEALDFVRTKMGERFKALGVPKDQISGAVAQDLRTFGLKALQAGANPAEKIFQLAKVEGYTGGRNAVQQLNAVAKGVAATRGARSSAPASNGELTPEQAVKLSYSELQKMSDSQWKRLMGG